MTGRWYPFTEGLMSGIVPLAGMSGIYQLAGEKEILRIGASRRLQEELRDLLAKRPDCLKDVLYFRVTGDANPEARLQEELQIYRERFGRLPRCQDREMGNEEA